MVVAAVMTLMALVVAGGCGNFSCCSCSLRFSFWLHDGARKVGGGRRRKRGGGRGEGRGGERGGGGGGGGGGAGAGGAGGCGRRERRRKGGRG